MPQDLREWLSHEIELASIRRHDAAPRDHGPRPSTVNTPVKADGTTRVSRTSPLQGEIAKRPATEALEVESPQSKRARNALGFLANFKPPKRRQKLAVDAANGDTTATVQQAQSEENGGQAGKRARIRFNKGFTNAVRRPALMNDFLPATR